MGSQEGQSVLPGRTDRPAPPPLPFLLLWLSLYIFTPECRAARRVIVLWALLEVFVLCSKLNLRFLHLRSHNSITFKVTLRRAQSSPVQLSSAGWSSVLVSPAQSADSRQWCSSGNTLAEVNQGLEWKGIGHSSGGVGGGFAMNRSPVIRDWASAHTHEHTHTLPCPEDKRARNRATVWTLTIRQQSWWSPSLTSVTPPLWSLPLSPPSEATARSVWLTLYYPHPVT